ncbi:MAG: energy transducer TonB [Terriglobales bacterium]
MSKNIVKKWTLSITIYLATVLAPAQIFTSSPRASDIGPPIKVVKPIYPKEAIELWQEQQVVLFLTIGKDGHVESAASPQCCIPKYFLDAARSAVMQWVYKPLLLNGRPMQVTTTATVRFTLDEDTRPLHICTLLRRSDAYDGKLLNVKGSIAKKGSLQILKSPACAGEIVVAESKDWEPTTASMAEAFKKLKLAPEGEISLRGRFEHHKGPGALTFDRLFLEQILNADSSPNQKD